MPGQTSKGFPYPIGTDKVSQGDDTLQALAVKLNDGAGASASGFVTVTGFTSPPQTRNVTVTFPVGRFTDVPYATVVGRLTNPDSGSVGVLNVTAAGMTVYAFRAASASDINTSWVAHQ